MEFDEVVLKRRSIRKFLSIPVEREKLARIMAAGNEAPCAGNIPNWRFVLIEDAEIKNKLAEACLEQFWIAKAPSIIVVCSQLERLKRYYGKRGVELYSKQNCAAAVENMLLEAVNLGLASCWVGAFEDEAVSRVLELPEGVEPQAILPIGYPAEQVPRPMRFKLSDMCFFQRWGNRIEFPDSYTRDYALAEKLKGKVKKIVGKE